MGFRLGHSPSATGLSIDCAGSAQELTAKRKKMFLGMLEGSRNSLGFLPQVIQVLR
jgi:hypothetical protein